MSVKIRFYINISNEEFLKIYQGSANAVLVRAEDGRRIQIPANNFRQFVTAVGLQGHFEMVLDENNRLINLLKVG
jgi:hypothetical protein